MPPNYYSVTCHLQTRGSASCQSVSPIESASVRKTPWFRSGPHNGPSATTGLFGVVLLHQGIPRRQLMLNLRRDGRLSIDHLRDHQIATGFVGVLLDYAA